MGLLHILFSGIVLLLLSFLAVVIIHIRDKKKPTAISGKIIAVIEEGETVPVEYAVGELVNLVNKMEDKGITLDIYLVNRSENPETTKMLTIINNKYDMLHIIDNGQIDTKSDGEILHIGKD